WNFLVSDASVLKKRGPKNPFLVALPKVPAAGRLQGPRVQPLAFSRAVAVAVLRQFWPLVPGVAVANQPAAVGFEILELPTRLGRQGPVSSSLPQLTYDGVNGMPDSHVPRAATCQPPRTRSVTRDAFFRKCLFFPKGSS